MQFLSINSSCQFLSGRQEKNAMFVGMTVFNRGMTTLTTPASHIVGLKAWMVYCHFISKTRS